MTKRKRIIGIVMALLMVFSLAPATVLAGTSDDSVSATIRIEALEGTIGVPEEVTMSYKTLSSYGFNISSEPEVLTPIHFLAEYFEGYGGALDNLGISSSGYLNTIMGSSGSVEDNYNAFWMFTINDKTPINNDSGYGYGINQYPVKDGDEIVIYATEYTGSPFYYTYFDDNNYEGEVGDPMDVTLLGFDNMDFSENGETIEAISDATILADASSGGGAYSPTSFVTDNNGVAQLVFDEPGVYEISAIRGESTDISRPYAIVNVSEGDSSQHEKIVDDDIDALSIPTETSSDLSLPSKGESKKTRITWTSNNQSVISKTGKITRPEVGQNPASVTLTATVEKGEVLKTKDFVVSVLPYTEEEIDIDINKIKAALGSSFKATEYVHTNFLEEMQKKADSVVNGSVLSISDSANAAVDSQTGEISYASSQKKGDVVLNIALSGVSRTTTISVTVPMHLPTAQEALNNDADEITWDKIKGNNTDPSNVTSSIKLPTYGSSYVTDITWTISDTNTISKYGTVTRPLCGNPDATVNLKARIAPNSYMMAMMGYYGDAVPTERAITITVPAITASEYNSAKDDMDAVASNMSAYIFKNYSDSSQIDLNQINGDIQLNDSTFNLSGGSIAWGSSCSAITINTYRGNVTRPEVGQPDVTGQIYADLSKMGYTTRVAFDVTVKALTQEEVDAELEYMEKVKEALDFGVIKGSNIDANNVVDDLSMVYRGYVDEEGNVTFGSRNTGNTGVIITWTSSDSNFPYEVNRPPLGSADKEVTLTATLTSQKILRSASVPEMKKEIKYIVKAYSDGSTEVEEKEEDGKVLGESANPVSASIKKLTPKKFKVKAQKKKAKLTWKKSKGITKYQVAYKKKGTKKWKYKLVSKNKKSVTIKKLKGNKKYQFKIRSYKKVNGKKAYSKWSKTKTIKVKR